MTPTVTLSKGAVSVTIPAPARFGTVAVRLGQARGRTAGGELYVYDLGTERIEAELEFRSLSGTQRDDLLDFFENTALGMSEQWTYTDPVGATFGARFIGPALEFVQVARNVWDVRLALEITSPVD